MEFLPVILGSDWNVYGVAASFYKEYGIKSAALCSRKQNYVNNLSYLSVYDFDKFNTPGVFVKELIKFAKNNVDKKLLLISCSDYYTDFIVSNSEKLKKYYLFNVIEKKLQKKLENKMDFYEVCKKYNLTYPDTYIISKENYTDNIPLDFPVICKPNDSYKWLNFKFEGYKKAYYVKNEEELRKILNTVYKKGYEDYMIIQNYIPGGPEDMFVVNAYVDSKGKVVMTHAAQTALDEVLPNDIGNYNALISGDFSELTQSVKSFLEQIHYKGYANFDFKFDRRNKTFNVFEINLRQGKSSMYMTYAGNNFTKYIVNDLIYGRNQEYYNHTDEHLWYITSKHILRKYCPDILKNRVNYLIKAGKSNYGLEFSSKENVHRFLTSMRRKLSTLKYYPKLVTR
ncbi:carboxylate--amine ligase [Helcococcus kunzii]|uniref:carboxylate--amine ligase n=1 Tax=Helcococcus kunzii TaxID=40091 RepID=UPI0024AD122A|nr:carboxylate--amine ligase [Helcococcus kunzii]